MSDIYKSTITSLFIVPILRIDKKELTRHGFENAYIKDEVRGLDYPHAIYLLFRAPNQLAFNEFIEEERDRKVLIDEYDYRDGWTVLVYRYHEQWQEDIDILMQGRYSEVSDAYKREIPAKSQGAGAQTTMTMQHHVFNKTQFIKNSLEKKYGIGDVLEADSSIECWSYYPERDVFTQDLLDKLI